MEPAFATTSTSVTSLKRMLPLLTLSKAWQEPCPQLRLWSRLVRNGSRWRREAYF